MRHPYVKTEIFGLERILAALGSLKTGLVDLRRAAPANYRIFADANSQNFLSEGGLVGGWESLSEGYALSKQKTHPGQGIMRRENRLFLSLTDGDHPDAIYDVSDQYSTTFGSGVEYARRHHYGDPGINLPARELLVLTPPMEQDYRSNILEDSAIFAEDLGFEVLR